VAAAEPAAGTISTPLMLAIGDALGSNLVSQEWRTAAACRGQDPEWWHPVRDASVEPHRRICRSCPVKVKCLEYALAGGAKGDGGIWAGSSARDRRRARRRGLDARRLSPRSKTATIRERAAAAPAPR
jgi:WhiB family redox-sensing transcriptional regulator